jgi:hypothetical protein
MECARPTFNRRKIVHFYYDCPTVGCDALIEVDERYANIRCPSCHVLFELDTDADYHDGAWHDLTRLVPAVDHTIMSKYIDHKDNLD